MNTAIIYSKQGEGKTMHSDRLKAEFGCQRVLDEWRLGEPIEAGDLVLTNDPAVLGPLGRAADIKVLTLAEALVQCFSWKPSDTAPRDRLILADMGMPWVSLAIWNEPSGTWCITDLEVDLYEGKLNDWSISHTFESHKSLRGWMELPEVSRG